ncbi:MAG: proton-conducting transporter membrane subunit [Candidatus Omnitrophota bacterium]
MGLSNLFIFDSLSLFVGGFVLFFTAVIFIYSLGFIRENRLNYYLWFFLTAAVSLGVVLSRRIELVIIFWGFLGLTFFQMINLSSDDKAAATAKKAFIIIGASDAFMLLGFLLYFHLTSNVFIDGSSLVINDRLSLLAFLLVAAGCFAKAGCMPFHTWIPDVAQRASLPVVAYLPASVDKLLGIYLLVRIVKDTFVLDTTARVILLVCGALTVIFAVMMALVQHNIKKLLGYHAVSQVGYMVLGIGCGSVLGLAAGLLHMLNHAIYKSCLFLGAGNVETRTASDELDDLGGLAKFMPITFIATVIAAFSISGIPPFNGFVSKWMVYQALVDYLKTADSAGLKIVISLSLIMALIGSGLTLASFLKLLSGVFLGKAKREVKEVGFLLYFPLLVLAFLCIIFGLFFNSTARRFIEASLGEVHIGGLWQPGSAMALIVLGLIIGWVIYKLSAAKIRLSSSYVGGETIDDNLPVGDFYSNIKDMPFLKKIYLMAEEKSFDLYEQGKKGVFFISGILRFLHNGILPTYLAWCLLGILGLFFVFLR